MRNYFERRSRMPEAARRAESELSETIDILQYKIPALMPRDGLTADDEAALVGIRLAAEGLHQSLQSLACRLSAQQAVEQLSNPATGTPAAA